MYPTVTVEHLASDTTAIDDSANADDMKIYQFDYEVPIDSWVVATCAASAPGNRYQTRLEVLAA